MAVEFMPAPPDEITFPKSVIISVMGPNGGRWINHRKFGQIAYIDDHAGPDGSGRGVEVRLSIGAILQGCIALRLIDCGVEVRRAYQIGAKVAYFGQGLPPSFGDSPPPKPDPMSFRSAGRLFRDGDTWLIVSPWGDDGGCLNYEMFTDATLAGVDGSRALASILTPVDADHQPNIFLNVTEVCRFIAKCLELSFEDTFLTESV